MTPEPPPAGTPVAADLLTPDPSGVAGFYRALLGWTITDAGSGLMSCRAADGTAVATIREAGGSPSSGWLVTFAGPDPAVTSTRVTEAGGGVVFTRGDDGYYTDPAGIAFAVSAARDRSALQPGEGRPSWFELMTTAAHDVDRFYTAVLGHTVIAPPDADPATSPFALLTVAGRTVAGRLHLPPELAPVLAGRWMVYFAQSAVDEAAVRCGQLGGSVLVPPRDAPTGRLTALRDPAGSVFTVLRPRR